MAVGPCAWPVNVTCYDDWATTDPALQAAATAWASAVLWGLTGRQFDSCPVTVRPCGKCVGQTYRTYGVWTDTGVYGAGVGPTWIPYIDIDGSWRNCGCTSMCSCEPASQAWLGAGPISAITEVRVDNVIVPPQEYRLDVHKGGYWLVGQLGRVWPECQNLNDIATSSDNTFTVAMVRGTPVPDEGEVMAGILAAEFVKYCANGECALSPNATSISRDGVSFEVASAATVIADGFTGHPIVDAWIYSVNPKKKTTRPRVYSPDMPYPRVTI